MEQSNVLQSSATPAKYVLKQISDQSWLGHILFSHAKNSEKINLDQNSICELMVVDEKKKEISKLTTQNNQHFVWHQASVLPIPQNNLNEPLTLFAEECATMVSKKALYLIYFKSHMCPLYNYKLCLIEIPTTEMGS